MASMTAAVVSACSDDGGAASIDSACVGDGCSVEAGSPSVEAGGADASRALTCPMAKVAVPGLGATDTLGASLATDGTLAAVGAPTGNDPSGSPTGVVHLLERDGCVWKHRGAAVASGLVKRDEFGASVALAAGTLLVGAPRVKEYTSSGTTVTTVTGVGAAFSAAVPPSGTPLAASFQKYGGVVRASHLFGASVALSPDGKIIAAGAPGYGYNSGLSEVVAMGAVWLFDAAANGAAIDALYGPVPLGRAGSAVVVGPSFILSGAPGSDNGAGKVHVHTPGGADASTKWLRSGEIRPKAASAGSRFGAAISVVGDVAVVGAPDLGVGEAGAASAGAAYVFVRGSDGVWAETQELKPSDGGGAGRFGHAIVLGNDVLLVGAPGLPGAPEAGAVYVFEKKPEGFVQKARLLSPETAPGDGFGSALAVSGVVVIAGAPNAAQGAGAIFTFTP